MKRLFIIICFLLLVTGCKNDREEIKESGVDYNKITKYYWGIGTEVIYFNENNHFAYYDSGSGNPVDDYDLCETYSFSDDVIKLKCDDKNIVSDLKIISVDDEKLILDFDGTQKEFERGNEIILNND